jgi:uncharacterized membrane protein
MKTQKTTNNSQSSTRAKLYDKKKIWLETIPFIICLILFLGAIAYYPKIPSVIPTHWNAAGEVDGYGGRGTIFIMPIVLLVILILFLILPLMEVFRENMIAIYWYYYMFKILFSLFFAGLFVAMILSILGYNINVSAVVIIMIGVLFISLGFILPKLKRNFMFGIRTGWTMSSDLVWSKTHKIGGVLFAIIGAIIIAAVFIIKLEILFWIFIGLIFSVSLFLIFYSYYLYKKVYKQVSGK